MTSKYKYGTRSKARQRGLHKDLKDVLNLGLKLSEVDITILEGKRTKDRQRELVDQGKSQTMDSRHLTGHAADAAPWVDGGVDWDNMEDFYKVAEAMRTAARELGVPLRWGGCWQRIDNTTAPLKELVEQYVARRRRQGKKVFIDAPHFELLRKYYPA